MKRFMAFLFLVLMFSGCSMLIRDGHRKDNDRPTPAPTVVPKEPKGIPSIVDNQLRIDGKRVFGLGVYDLIANDDYFTPSVLETFFRDYSEAGCNAMRVWVKMYYGDYEIQPWVRLPDGRYDLGQPNPDFYSRMNLIASKADRYGVCIMWVYIDYCTIKHGFGFVNDGSVDVLCPTRHLDPLEGDEERRMMTLSGYFNENGDRVTHGAPRARRPYKCDYYGTDPNQGCSDHEIGCRTHPAWWELFRRTAEIAKFHRDVIYIGSEMCSGDLGHDQWDERAMMEYTAKVRDFTRSIYPNCIIGISLSDVNYRVYSQVQIADIHGLGFGVYRDPYGIAQSVSESRAAGINGVICVNGDGCQEAWLNGIKTDRYETNWMIEAATKAWDAGVFFEQKADSFAIRDHGNKIKDALRAVKDRR